ncbi:MAG: DEAD/DEAH box helicase, partial [Thiovulaceae bacterium]|nr:DEAD/DEAH box helicase [Sulfurimonadaceae bacterium]
MRYNTPMQNLPIHQVIPRIVAALNASNRLVLQAPPGAGKTTAVPLALLDEEWLEGRQIIMLEPRRLAARTAAARMAELLGEKVGERVGYQIRADRRVSDKTKIIVVTEGILTRMLQGDPALENAALLIFDEFHERNLHGDLALALALQSQELLNSELKIMVMSATLNTEAIAELLEGAPIITSEGQSFPVENI